MEILAISPFSTRYRLTLDAAEAACRVDRVNRATRYVQRRSTSHARLMTALNVSRRFDPRDAAGMYGDSWHNGRLFLPITVRDIASNEESVPERGLDSYRRDEDIPEMCQWRAQ